MHPEIKRGVWVSLILFGAACGMLGVSHVFSSREQAAFASMREAGPRVVRVRPANGDLYALPDTAVAADIRFPSRTVVAGIDPTTLNDISVRLTRDDGSLVPGRLNTSGASDAIVFTPADPLEAGRSYKFEVNENLLDLSGTPFRPWTSTFKIASNVQSIPMDVRFERTPFHAIPEAVFTCVAFGPDRRLYAATFDGRIFRFDLDTDGNPTSTKVSRVIVDLHHGPRMIMGIAFDPTSPPDAPTLWISHGQMKPFERGEIKGADDWTGAISTVSGADLDLARDIVVGLPRAFKDHLNFQPAFGPDGALYFTQGSHTSIGEPDAKWGMRPERLLTAAVLRLDPTKLPAQLPIDVRTEPLAPSDRSNTGKSNATSLYDPTSPDAPLTIYATGVRSAFDLLWHRSGRLYSAVNGTAPGGNLPARPASEGLPALPVVRDLDYTTDDTLIQITPGSYHGHPNPLRREFIAHAGNPSPGFDPYGVPGYPDFTMSEPTYRMPVLSFGKNVSPNGLIEFRSDAGNAPPAFGGALEGAIIVARYSGGDDLVALRVDASGEVVDMIVGIEGFRGFVDPLDLTIDPTNGRIYVAEFGGSGLSLLKPAPGSSRVFVRSIESLGAKP
jgi:hypothetical protein